ncbi:family 10 glycosylhydrolase [Flavisolibacter sp. BT320]|nr:family 10 glycosylhydrolase [Flavisolibacter longurius]
MTNRRKFLKAGVFTGISAALQPVVAAQAAPTIIPNKNAMHWVWTRPKDSDKESELRKQYKRFYEAGVKGIFFEADSEKHYRLAKEQKLEAHRWMWTLNRGEKSLLQSHPEWYAKNRKGESCADKPPYVGYYRWLCPSREEVAQYLEADVKQILSKDYIDGIHLDYVRFCDVILPVNLWDTYKIEQTKELPEYDYCYCEVCQQKFREWKGKEISNIQYPEESLSWRLYRYNAVTNIVNRLAKVAQAHKKPITAAVFPTPEVAKRNVRQDWVSWNLDWICPMIYHGFYKEDVAWIGSAVAEGVKALNGKFPLYAGIYLPDFKNTGEIKQGVVHALKNGAAGVSLFGNVTEEVLRALEQATASQKNKG